MSKPWAFDDLSDANLLRVFGSCCETVAKRLAMHAARTTPSEYRACEMALERGGAVAQLRASLDSSGTIALWLLGGEGEPIALIGQFSARTEAPPAH